MDGIRGAREAATVQRKGGGIRVGNNRIISHPFMCQTNYGFIDPINISFGEKAAISRKRKTNAGPKWRCYCPPAWVVNIARG